MDNNTLAIVARDANGSLGRSYTGYLVPNTGQYIITCKQGTSYSYRNCLNEQAFFAAWDERESLPYTIQTVPNIDYSLVTLQDAVLENAAATTRANDVLIHNQLAYIEANEYQNELLQGIKQQLASNGASATPATTTAHVVVDNQPATYPVTGKFWPDTQPVSVTFPTTQQVSGTVSIAGTVPVSIAFPTSQHVTIDNPTTTVAVSNQPSTYPVTGTFWQAVQPVSVTTLPLPNGAATAANQLDTNTLLAAQNAKLGGTLSVALAGSQHVTVDNPVTTVAVSALPGGIATTTNQLIGNTSLASIDSKLTSPLTVKLQPAAPTKTIISSLVGTTSTLVKTGSTQLYSVIASNVSTATVYLSLYNKATAPVTADVPAALYAIAPGSSVQYSFATPSVFPLGLGVAITSNNTLTGTLTGLLAANQLVVNLETL